MCYILYILAISRKTHKCLLKREEKKNNRYYICCMLMLYQWYFVLYYELVAITNFVLASRVQVNHSKNMIAYFLHYLSLLHSDLWLDKKKRKENKKDKKEMLSVSSTLVFLSQCFIIWPTLSSIYPSPPLRQMLVF